jgi:nucleotide-binding universal stress UspA family protein
MYKHFLVPIDGSELSAHAIEHSVGLARQLGARITGFVAEPPPPVPSDSTRPHAYPREVEQHRAKAEAHARSVLAQFEVAAQAAGVSFEGRFHITDSVDESIVAAAHEYGCDLLVMATHGRSGLGELLFGSHTKHVISLSKLPVLVLH